MIYTLSLIFTPRPFGPKGYCRQLRQNVCPSVHLSVCPSVRPSVCPQRLCVTYFTAKAYLCDYLFYVTPLCDLGV